MLNISNFESIPKIYFPINNPIIDRPQLREQEKTRTIVKRMRAKYWLTTIINDDKECDK